MNATEYVFDKDALIKLLNCIKDYGVKRFLLVSASIYYGGFAPLRLIKDTSKSMLSLIGLYELGQFWGICGRLMNLPTLLKRRVLRKSKWVLLEKV